MGKQRLTGAPVRPNKLMRFANAKVEALYPELPQLLDDTERVVRPLRSEFEGEDRQRARQAGDHLRLVPLHVNLAEVGDAVPVKQRIKRCHIDGERLSPLMLGKSPRVLDARDPAV